MTLLPHTHPSACWTYGVFRQVAISTVLVWPGFVLESSQVQSINKSKCSRELKLQAVAVSIIRACGHDSQQLRAWQPCVQVINYSYDISLSRATGERYLLVVHRMQQHVMTLLISTVSTGGKASRAQSAEGPKEAGY